jgi:hypothetical protein
MTSNSSVEFVNNYRELSNDVQLPAVIDGVLIHSKEASKFVEQVGDVCECCRHELCPEDLCGIAYAEDVPKEVLIDALSIMYGTHEDVLYYGTASMKQHALKMMDEYDQVLNYVYESNDYIGTLKSVSCV